MRHTYNFSAGPAVLPETVLQEAAYEMMNYKGSGMSVMEISHRSALFQSIIDEAEHDLRTLMGIPDDHEVLFLQGGTSLQFAMIPMNFMRNQKADYILTGYWAKRAFDEAAMYGKVHVAASSEDRSMIYPPAFCPSQWTYRSMGCSLAASQYKSYKEGRRPPGRTRKIRRGMMWHCLSQP